MSLIKRISRIKNLKSVNPDKRWEKTIKYDLLEEISSQNRLMQAQKLSNTQKIDLFAMRFFNRMAPSMTKVLTSFLVFMMFFGVNIAAQASVPGEPLWPVKRSIEEVELSLTFSPVKKTEVHIRHVSKRLSEIDKILEQDIQVEEPKAQVDQEDAIKQAVSHLEQDIASVDSSLQVVKEEKEAIEIVELVKKVTTVTKEAIDDLEIKIKDTDSTVIGEALDGAKESQVEVESAAVDLAIEIHDDLVAAIEVVKELKEEVKPGTTTSTKESVEPILNKEEIDAVKAVVADIVAKQIDNLAERIDTTQEEVNNVIEEELAELADVEEDKEIAEGPEQSLEQQQIVDTIDNIDNIKENPEAASVMLDEAKVLLKDGSFKDAIEKVSESKELNDKSEVILEKLNNLQGDTEVVVSDGNQEKPVEVIVEVLSDTVTSTVTSTVAIEPVEDIEVIEASGVKLKETEGQI